MAKKFGKFLLFTAAVGGAAAAAYYYFQKKDTENISSEDEDYDDFSEELDDDPEIGKKYVTLSADGEASSEEPEKEKEEGFVPLGQVVQPVNTPDADTVNQEEPEVEEFFDEEDGSDEEPPIKDN